MKKGDVVAWRLVPADQNASKAVHPAVSAFHHPAPGFETGFIFDGPSFFAPAANVGREAKLVQSLTHLVEVVALIQAQSLGTLRGGSRALYREAVQRSTRQLHVVAVGPVYRQSHRNTPSFGQQTAFDAGFTPVRGVGTGFSPRPGGTWLWLHPCSRKLQSRPFNSSYRSSPTCQSRKKTPAAAHS